MNQAVRASTACLTACVHVDGHNRRTIGICLLGGYGAKADDLLEKNFTVVQASATKRLIVKIKERTMIRNVSRLNDYAAKVCPSFKTPRSIRHHKLQSPSKDCDSVQSLVSEPRKAIRLVRTTPLLSESTRLLLNTGT